MTPLTSKVLHRFKEFRHIRVGCCRILVESCVRKGWSTLFAHYATNQGFQALGGSSSSRRRHLQTVAKKGLANALGERRFCPFWFGFGLLSWSVFPPLLRNQTATARVHKQPKH